MIITDEFVYIHTPKTGGTFVAAALRRVYESRDGTYIDTSLGEHRRKLGVRDQHQTVSEIPPAYRDRPIAVTVRNPFDHYVSFYEFEWWKHNPGDTFDEAKIRVTHPHYPDITFEEYIRAVYDWTVLDHRYIPEEIAAQLDAAGLGPLTHDYIRFLFERPGRVLEDPQRFVSDDRYREELRDVCFLRREALNRDLYEFLLSVGHDRDAVRFILDMDRVYPAGGRRRTSPDWESYYTPELRRLIRGREWFLFSLFPGYDDGALTASPPSRAA